MVFAERASGILANATGWVTSRRWYGDKSRKETSIVPETIVPVELDGIHAAMAILRVAYERGVDSRYFVPVMLDAGNAEPEDALANANFLRWFVGGFADNRSLREGWRWEHLSGDVPEVGSITPDKVRVIAAEQSNTSVVIDRRWIIKVFRKLQPGINPDLEIGAFLSHHNRFPHAPALYGLVQIEENDDTTIVAALQQFVPNQGDGWSWLLERLSHLDESSSNDLIDDIALLGRRTAGLHLALASDDSDPAFAPEVLTRDDADATIRRVVAEMEQSVEGLARRLTPPEVEQIHKGLGQLMGGAWSLVGSMKTRVHGDYHLGQTLRTLDDDFCLIDFEGEPSRPMNQRREKQTPLKDVAGMLRSLDYAAATAIAASGDNRDAVRTIEAWLPAASDAFDAAYRQTIMESRPDLLPADPEAYHAGLNLMIAEKALYEIRYELDNRPDWLSIPLNGIRRLAGIPVPDAG